MEEWGVPRPKLVLLRDEFARLMEELILLLAKNAVTIQRHPRVVEANAEGRAYGGHQGDGGLQVSLPVVPPR